MEETRITGKSHVLLLLSAGRVTFQLMTRPARFVVENPPAGCIVGITPVRAPELP